MWRLKGVIFQFSSQLPNHPLISFLSHLSSLPPPLSLHVHSQRASVRFQTWNIQPSHRQSKAIKSAACLPLSPAQLQRVGAGPCCMPVSASHYAFLISMEVSQAENKYSMRISSFNRTYLNTRLSIYLI